MEKEKNEEISSEELDNAGSGGCGLGISAGDEYYYEDGYLVYVARLGDTLTKIAAKFGTSWQVLSELNSISNTQMIRKGQKIRIRRQ